MSKILVVDDDGNILQVVEAALLMAGHEVVAHSSGREAIKSAAAGKFDVVITDILMPDMDGMEMIRELRRTCPEVSIVAMSGGGRAKSDDYLAIARKLGAELILTKPFTPQELLNVVQTAAG